MTYLSRRETSHSLHKWLFKVFHFSHKFVNKRNKERTRSNFFFQISQFLTERVNTSHSATEFSQKELISKELAQLCLDNALSCFIKFQRQQLKQVAQWEFACLEMHGNVEKKNFWFFLVRNVQTQQSLALCNPVSPFPKMIFLNVGKRLVIKETMTPKLSSHSKCFKEGRKRRFVFFIVYPIVHFLF